MQLGDHFPHPETRPAAGAEPEARSDVLHRRWEEPRLVFGYGDEPVASAEAADC